MGYVISHTENTSSRVNTGEAKIVKKGYGKAFKTSKPIVDVKLDRTYAMLYAVLDDLKCGEPMKEIRVFANILITQTKI